MRQSKLFTKVERTAPKDEEAINAKLLIRAGFVQKNSAGVYTYLPLGWRVIQRIMAIVREEMDAIGGEELFFPALVEEKYLRATGRDKLSVGFRTQHEEGNAPQFILGWTHEEIVTSLATKYIRSYKDLPAAIYQMQTKFRNEPRAKSGLLRGREFLMKDLYSFHTSQEDFEEYYKKVAEAYHRVFARVGLKAVYTLALGGDFTASRTHEFQVVSNVGEDTIYACAKCGYAENKEVATPESKKACVVCGGDMEEKTSIEVGNIFPLGTKYAESFNLKFTDADGSKKYVVMGSYGIGISRVMATIVEVLHDEAGMIWPEAVAPYAVHLLELPGADAKEVYETLVARGIEVLYDDRDMNAGEKFAEADLLGIPYRAVLGTKYDGKIELKRRSGKDEELISPDELAERFATK